MNRNGKIARLPAKLREEFNQRLENGQQGQEVLDWLNGVEEAKAMLKQHFKGQPFNKQNVSEWRLGGYQDWLRRQERLRLARDMYEETDSLVDFDYRPEDFAGNLAVVLGLELATVSQELLREAKTPEERFGRLQGVLKELSQLRRDIDRGRRTKIAEDRWFKQDCYQDAEYKAKQQKKLREAELLRQCQEDAKAMMKEKEAKGRGAKNGKAVWHPEEEATKAASPTEAHKKKNWKQRKKQRAKARASKKGKSKGTRKGSAKHVSGSQQTPEAQPPVDSTPLHAAETGEGVQNDADGHSSQGGGEAGAGSGQDKTVKPGQTGSNLEPEREEEGGMTNDE